MIFSIHSASLKKLHLFLQSLVERCLYFVYFWIHFSFSRFIPFR